MGVDAADYDNDGRPDLYATHFASDYSTLYHNLGGLLFEDVTVRARIRDPEWPDVKWGTRMVDLDQDGWKDIVHANGHVYPHLRSVCSPGRSQTGRGRRPTSSRRSRSTSTTATARSATCRAKPAPTRRCPCSAAAPPSPTSTTTGTSTW